MKRNQLKKKILTALVIFLLFYSVGEICCFLQMSMAIRRIPDFSTEEGKEIFCAMQIDDDILQTCYEKRNTPWFPLLFGRGNKGKQSADVLKSLSLDWKKFPVKKDKRGKETVYYEDSWGGVRTFGGKRRHEGTDLLASNNQRGYFPIISVSDGVIEKKGWLTLGGWRVGIRAPHGTYFYYAHLAGYADGLEEGNTVKAGQIIGYMGDSGYGKEGTVGQFAVHLHFGIYYTVDGREISLNPYPLLKRYDSQ